MKIGLWKKGLVLGIIVLFVGAGVIPSMGGTVVEKTTSTIISSPGYIQDLIDNASDGDTINIPSGMYYENITINKSISLIGEDKNTTIIQYNSLYDDVVEIVADWVNISGFTIIQYSESKKFIPEGILILDANNITISGNIISNCISCGIEVCFSNDNVITNNLILDNGNGISLFSSKGNSITNNLILDNSHGIDVYYSNNNVIIDNLILDNHNEGIYLNNSNGNILYHNNFINNTQNAYDNSVNIWDTGKSGNYWDDYTGEDADGNGIGDTPYLIPSGDNEDRYPLMEPWGGGNQPPNASTIDGPIKGKPGIDYDYTFVATDPDEDYIWYLISWGDKEIIYQYGPLPSGEELTLSHNWTYKGSYNITCWVRDIYDAESNWTYFDVEIETPRNRAVYHPLLLRFFERFPLLERLLSAVFN